MKSPTDAEIIATLRSKAIIFKEALQAASDHLDYCCYGDSWERECAIEQKLEEQITAALEINIGE